MIGDAKKNHMSVPRNHDFCKKKKNTGQIFIFYQKWSDDEEGVQKIYLTDTAWTLREIICIHQVVLPALGSLIFKIVIVTSIVNNLNIMKLR